MQLSLQKLTHNKYEHYNARYKHHYQCTVYVSTYFMLNRVLLCFNSGVG